jgi:hypothetical protein
MEAGNIRAVKWNLQSLRWAGLIGLAVVLVNDAVVSLPWKPRQEYGLAMLAFFIVAVVIISLLLMPKAVGALWRNKDLLLPLALLTTVLQLIEWLTALPALGSLLNASRPVHLFKLSFALSAGSILTIGAFVAYATWMTATIVAFVRAGQNNPCAAMPAAFKHFWRVFGLQFIGVFTVIVGIALLLSLMPAIGTFTLILMALFGVLWNFSTAALLPVGIESGQGFWAACRAGMRASLANLPKWWLLLLAQMLLLGMLMFFSVGWNQGGTHHTNLSWNVNVFWIGGYEDECRWYGKLVEVYQTTAMPLIKTLLTLLFGAMAVGVKLAIVQRLQKEPAATVSESTSAVAS